MNIKILTLSALMICVSCASENDRKVESFTSFYTGEVVDVFSSNNLNLVNQVFMADSRLINHMESLFVVVTGQFILEGTEHEPGLEVFSYSNNNSLDGAFVKLSINQSNPKNIDVELYTGDNISFRLCTIQNAISVNGIFEIAIQFDNFLSGGRVTLWNFFISPESRQNLNFNLINLNTSSCSTQGRTSINRLGFGHRWGLMTNFVKVHDVKRKSPYEL